MYYEFDKHLVSPCINSYILSCWYSYLNNGVSLEVRKKESWIQELLFELKRQKGNWKCSQNLECTILKWVLYSLSLFNAIAMQTSSTKDQDAYLIIVSFQCRGYFLCKLKNSNLFKKYFDQLSTFIKLCFERLTCSNPLRTHLRIVIKLSFVFATFPLGKYEKWL